VTTTVFREVTEKECSFYKEIAEFYGYRPNVRPYATGSSSVKADSERPPTNRVTRRKAGGTEEEDRNAEFSSVEKTCYKSRNLRSFAEEEKAPEERKGSRVKK